MEVPVPTHYYLQIHQVQQLITGSARSVSIRSEAIATLVCAMSTTAAWAGTTCATRTGARAAIAMG